MITTNTRPFPLVCGGVNALAPLHRNCDVEACDCATAEPPVGAWWDGFLLVWPDGQTLNCFGRPVMSVDNFIALAGEDADDDLEFMRSLSEVDGDFQTSATNILMGRVIVGETPPAGWEHYGFMLYPTHISGLIANAYALGSNTIRVGLAATVTTPTDRGRLRTNDGEGTPISPATLPDGKRFVGAVRLPWFAQDETVEIIILDSDTRAEKRRVPGRIYGNETSSDNSMLELGLYMSEDDLDEFRSSEETLSIAVESLPGIDHVFTQKFYNETISI